MIKRRDINEYYNHFTPYLIKDRIYPNQRHKRIYSLIDEIVERKKIDSALEVGCGIGIISEYIRKYIPEVYAIDLSENNISFAARTVKDVHFIKGDFLSIDIDKKFGLITYFDVLEHIEKSRHPMVFERIGRYLKDDTLIAITIPDPEYLDYVREHHFERLQVVDESIYFEQFYRIIKDFNFDILKYEKYGIDYEDQYRYYLLTVRRNPYVIIKKKSGKKSAGRIFVKLIKRVGILIRRKKYSKLM